MREVSMPEAWGQDFLNWHQLRPVLKLLFPRGFVKWGDVDMHNALWDGSESITLVFTKRNRLPLKERMNLGREYDTEVARLTIEQEDLLKALELGASTLGEYLSTVIVEFLDEKFAIDKAPTFEESVVVKKTIECGHCRAPVEKDADRCEHCKRAFY